MLIIDFVLFLHHSPKLTKVLNHQLHATLSFSNTYLACFKITELRIRKMNQIEEGSTLCNYVVFQKIPNVKCQSQTQALF